MNIIKKINFDEEGFYDETYFFNGQEITETQFRGLEDDLKSEDSEFEEECNCADCCGCDYDEDRDLEDIIHETVTDIYNGSHCPYCIEDRLREFLDEVFDYLEE